MQIEELEGVIVINGLEISGFIDKTKKCTKCQNYTMYDDSFDAYFCANCNEWQEEKCSDPHCYYCVQRPDYPLPTAIRI